MKKRTVQLCPLKGERKTAQFRFSLPFLGAALVLHCRSRRPEQGRNGRRPEHEPADKETRENGSKEASH